MGDSCLIYGIYARAARKRDWRIWTFLFFINTCEKGEYLLFFLWINSSLDGSFLNLLILYNKKTGEIGKKRVAGVVVIYEEGVSNVWKRIPRR